MRKVVHEAGEYRGRGRVVRAPKKSHFREEEGAGGYTFIKKPSHKKRKGSKRKKVVRKDKWC